MKRFQIFFSIIKVPMDFTMTVLGFIIAYQLRLITGPIEGLAKPIDYSALPTENEYLIFSVWAALALIIIFAINKMYLIKSTSKFSQEIGKTSISCTLWIMAIITYFFFTRTLPFSRLAIFYSWSFTFIFIIMGRWLIKLTQKILFHFGIGQTKLVFLGNNEIAQEINKELIKNQSYQILGIIGDRDQKTKIKVLGSIADFQKIVKKYHVDQIIQTKSDFKEIKDDQILEFCELNHIDYRFIPDLLEVRRSNVKIETIAGVPIINLKPTPLDGWGKVIKRASDVFGAGIGLILLSPIFLITAIAIKMDSKGPVFFTKLDDGSPAQRVGQKAKLFTCYKFRSMKPNTHNQRYNELAHKNTRTEGPLVKIENDPRVTHVGKFIRHYSIDELPQLWNVLIGNMSLVGPRPHMAEEVEKYQKHQHFVLTIKPGLSGLAQISGRSDLDFEQETKLDRYYIENWSILMDIKIILKTVGVVLKGHKE